MYARCLVYFTSYSGPFCPLVLVLESSFILAELPSARPLLAHSHEWSPALLRVGTLSFYLNPFQPPVLFQCKHSLQSPNMMNPFPIPSQSCQRTFTNPQTQENLNSIFHILKTNLDIYLAVFGCRSFNLDRRSKISQFNSSMPIFCIPANVRTEGSCRRANEGMVNGTEGLTKTARQPVIIRGLSI